MTLIMPPSLSGATYTTLGAAAAIIEVMPGQRLPDTSRRGPKSSRPDHPRLRAPRIDHLGLVERRLFRAIEQVIDALDALRKAVILVRILVALRDVTYPAVDLERFQ